MNSDRRVQIEDLKKIGGVCVPARRSRLSKNRVLLPTGRRWRATRRMRVGGITTSIGGNSRIPHPPHDFRHKSRDALSRFAPAAKPWTRERDKNRQSRSTRAILSAYFCFSQKIGDQTEIAHSP